MSNISKIKISGTSYDIKDENACKVVELTQAQYDALPASAKTSNSLFVITDAQGADLSNYYTKSETSGATEISTALNAKADTATTYTKTEVDNAITAATSTKQDTLVSGTNIKTINNQSILGSGNINIQGGGSGSSYTAGDGIDITNDVISVTGKVDTSTFNTYSGSVDTALAGKQSTLVSGTNIKTINNESILGSGNINIQGGSGGKTIEAGRGITVTTGETVDTVSFNLPISAGTGTGSLIIGDNDGGTSYASVASGRGAVVFPSRRFYGKNYATEESSFAHGSGCSAGTCSHAEGYNTKCMNGFNSHSEGQNTEARGGNSHSEGEGTFAGETYGINACHAEGYRTSAMTNYSHAEGYYTRTTNESEHSSGRYNVSNKANSTFGDSGNTLFSVGNGTADNARHNAFEIRQNGDIYIYLNGQDVKLQDILLQLSGSTT